MNEQEQEHIETLRRKLNRLTNLQTSLVIITCVPSYYERMSKQELAAARKTLRAIRRVLNEVGDDLNKAVYATSEATHAQAE